MSTNSLTRDALVVGICNYEYLNDDENGSTDLNKVKKINILAEQARKFAELLETQGGFKVTRLPSADLNEKVDLPVLEQAIEKLLSSSKELPTQTALLFFAGHGLIKKSWLGAEGFLATSEADGKSTYGVSLKWLRKLLRASPVRQQIVFLEACYSGIFFQSFKPDREHDVCFVTSSRANEEALAQGLLVQALLESLDCKKRLEDRITSGMLIKYLQKIEKNNGGSQRFVQKIHGQEIVLCGATASKEKQQNRVTNFLLSVTITIFLIGFIGFIVSLDEGNNKTAETKISSQPTRSNLPDNKSVPSNGSSETLPKSDASVVSVIQGNGDIQSIIITSDGGVNVGDINMGDKIEVKSPVPTTVKPFQTTVKAEQDWQPTGFNVLRGEKISIKVVGGQWNAADGFLADNDGRGYGYSCAQSAIAHKDDATRCSLGNYSLGALVALIGKVKYGIGNNCTFVVTDNGVVHLKMNDNNAVGNSGELTVELSRTPTATISDQKICGQPSTSLRESKNKEPAQLF